MKKPAVLAIVAIVALVALMGLLFAWLAGRPPKVIAQEPKEASERTAEVASSADVVSPDRPTPIPNQPPPAAPTVEPVPLPATAAILPSQNSGEETIRNATRPDGTYVKVPSVALRTYYVFMSLGRDGEAPTEAKDQFGLTDDEFKQVIEYSKTALRSDRQFQSNQTAVICANRSVYQTIDQFGAALNEYSLKADTNQESLGRNAQLYLGTALFSKIDRNIRGQRPREQNSVDFPKYLVVRHRVDLQAEIDLLCNARANRSEQAM